jgi:ribosomal protein S18 acetylase RimI-like enzyme
MVTSGEFSIRPARPDDTETGADLVVRLKRLNAEFDPMLKVAEAALDEARAYLREAIASDRHLVLVSERRGKIVGILKADLRDRRFYEPRTEGVIVDFYVLPEFRRHKLGEDLVEHATRHLRQKGAQIIAAEFPTQNQIAVRFYEKQGFRPLENIFARRSA